MNSIKILIVEDNIQFLYALQEALKEFKADIVSVGDGIVALEFVKTYKPDIVILDLNIPSLNGIELLEKIEQNKELSTSVIIVSGELNLINRIPGKHYNKIKGVFCKPVELVNIQESIKNIILKKKNIDNIEKMQKVLNNFSFNKTSKGYRYLVECIEEITEHPTEIKNIKKTVYPIIAKRHNIENKNKVKWCVVKTLKSMIRYTDKKILAKFFASVDEITPKNFMIQLNNVILDEELNT